ncbi:S1C family serine protease [Luteolibacter marinus]|uniref:S1C family serine protease n=1 Tax=Luteolibacter marinus TaxID=2776705 RepID=UPI001868D5DC|nr:PDZ domain-containing protein [Luteolibacter marinus]
MKTIPLFIAAICGLAAAQEPEPAAFPSARIYAVKGAPADIDIPTLEAGDLAEPLRWAFGQAGKAFEGIERSGPVGFLGVNAAVVPHELSAHLPLPQDTGLLVEVVAKDSPAAKAGLQPDDVLAKLDDQILIDPRQLSVLIANKAEGDRAKLTYVRKGETHEAEVVIARRESTAPATGHIDADILLQQAGGAPLRTFVRRFEIPGGHRMATVGESVTESHEVTAPDDNSGPATPANEDVKRELDEIRALLEKLQQKVK